MNNQLKLLSLNDAKMELLRLKEAKTIRTKNRNVSEICLHCSQTIEYSITGYPVMKPVFIRNTIGKLAFHKFMRQGYMTHDLTAPVPGGAKIDASVSSLEAINLLMDTIEKFNRYTGILKQHLLFGNLSKKEYDQYFAMHIADHLSCTASALV